MNSDELSLSMMQAELEESTRPVLNKILSEKGNLQEYWILLHCKWWGNVLKRAFTIHSTPPVIAVKRGGKLYGIPQIGSICWYRNNSWPDDKAIKRIWVLADDFPGSEVMLDPDLPDDPNLKDDDKRFNVVRLYH